MTSEWAGTAPSSYTGQMTEVEGPLQEPPWTTFYPSPRLQVQSSELIAFLLCAQPGSHYFMLIKGPCEANNRDEEIDAHEG